MIHTQAYNTHAYNERRSARVNIKLYLCVPLRCDNVIQIEGGAI